MADITLRVNGVYIGSAFSPVVEITDTAEGHTVTITDKDGPHSYTVPDWSSEEAVRVSNEISRVQAEASRQSAEAARAQAEVVRAGAEQTRSDAETSRAAAEAGRADAETARAGAESTRASSETTRVQNESTRQGAETTRQQNEAQRQGTLQAMVEQMGSASRAESERATAENLRVNSETARASAEDARAEAEAARVDAESARVTAESARVSAEAARVTAEQGRVEAEAARQAYVDGLQDLIDSKADIDGYYDSMAVGAADNLTGRGDGVTASYIYRTSGGTADIADGVATIKSIKGNTLRWNQLANFTDSRTVNGVTYTVNNGVITVNGSVDEGAGSAYVSMAIPVIAGHKYLIKGTPAGGSTSTYMSYVTGQSFNINQDTGSGAIGAPATTGNTYYVAGYIKEGYTANNLVFKPQLFDLTAAFGAGNEPSTVAEFEALYPEPYYPYDAGSLLSVDMRGVESTGFNLWDEEWEQGYIGSDGNNVAGTAAIRSVNYIPVFPNTTYYYRSSANGSTNPFMYDAEKRFIGRYGSYLLNAPFTTPANCHYLRFSFIEAYGNTYNHDTCLNLHWTGYRDGEYEPYWSFTREVPIADYFLDGQLRRAGNVSDELTSVAAVNRVGVGTVTRLGTVVTNTDMNMKYCSLEGTGVDAWPSYSAQPSGYNSVTSDVLGTTKGNMGTTQLAIGRTWNAIFAYAPLDSDDSIFDQLIGATVQYALANPVTTEFDTPLNLSYKVSDFGTERVLTDSTDTPPTAPPVMQVAYGVNAVDTIRRLPQSYISHESFTAFTSALASAAGLTISETWDATNGRYNYTITGA